MVFALGIYCEEISKIQSKKDGEAHFGKKLYVMNLSTLIENKKMVVSTSVKEKIPQIVFTSRDADLTEDQLLSIVDLITFAYIF